MLTQDNITKMHNYFDLLCSKNLDDLIAMLTDAAYACKEYFTSGTIKNEADFELFSFYCTLNSKLTYRQ